MQEDTLRLEEIRDEWLEQISTDISIGHNSFIALKNLVVHVRKANNRYAKNMIFSSPKEVYEFVKKEPSSIIYNSNSIFDFISFKISENYFVFSEAPTFLGLDEQKRLNCTTDYAIYFKDGFGLHYVHGIPFSKKLFEKFFKFKDYTGKDILNFKNVEQKAVLIQEHGYEKILEEVGAEVIDTQIGKSKITGKKVIYELLEFEINSAYLRLIKVEDHTTHKIVTLGVPSNMKTCMEAIAWTFGFDKEDYILYKES